LILPARHTNVWLVRHTQTDWNRAGRYQSRSDRPLTAFGEAHARSVAHRLRRAPLTALVSGGLARTDALARQIALGRTCAILPDPRWREADQGDWEGLSWAEVSAGQARQAQGGESIDDLWVRVEAAWDDLLRGREGGRALVVTEAGPIQLLLCALLGVPFARRRQFRVDGGGLTNVDLYPTMAILRVVNEVPALLRER
jgi:broad specificity phosphatase PhoE